VKQQAPKRPAWSVLYSDAATKTLEKLEKRDRATVIRIRNALLAVAATGEPRSRGRALTGNRSGQWRYRIGDWRAIAELRDAELIIETIEIGHRSDVY